MAIQTENIVDVRIEGVKVDEFGISDTLDNYSDSDIINYLYVAGNSRMLGGNIDFYANNAGSYDTWQDGMPFNTGAVNNTIMTMKSGDGTYECPATGRYLGVVLLHSSNDIYNDYITVTNSNGYVVITEFNAKKYLLEIGATLTQKANVGATSFTDTTNTLYNPHLDTLALKYKYGNDYVDTRYAVCPYHVLQYGGYLFLINAFNENETAQFRCSFNSSPLWNAGTVYYPFSYNDISKSISVSFNGYGFGTNWSNIAEQDFAWTYGGAAQTYSNSDYVYLFTDYGARQFRCYYYYKSYTDCMMMYANGGMYFRLNGGTIFKPLIDNNVVYGFTDNLDAESDIDNYDGSTKHDIPVTPPTPPTPTPEGDDFDDHEMGAGSGISGMANLWLLTKSQLNDLHSSFNNAPGGFDPMNSLISVMGLGVAPTYLFNDIEFITPINIRKSDGTSWSTGVEGHIVDTQNSAFQFTGITVNRKYNNFLDFSPYAIHEIFIPMCGWLTLPDIAVDRSITVTYLPDVESLKCRAVVSVVDNSGHRCVIGEKDGIMGADVPFTNTGHSLYVGEAIINGMNVAGEVITGAIGAGFTKTNAKGGTYRPYEGFTVGMSGTLPGAIGNALVSGQTNRTHYMTGNGTRIGFSDGENIQIKSTYHNIDKPSNYDHTVGKVCNKTGVLSEFHGFTVCDNPHIHISALEEEKSEIKALLEQGVILPSGE